MASVIQFPVVTPFLLREIVGSRGGVITDWLLHSPDVRALLRIRVGNLRKSRRVDWNKTEFRSLGGGLYEIKWNARDVPHRAFGCDHKGCFVLVIGCTHKGKNYDPRKCKDTARKLISEVKNGQWNTVPFEP
jgi:phage-related protein